jgi:16S rRNA (cytosine1402-N4)-methyltransferase
MLAPDDIVVDGTLGGAGHALAIARQLGTNGVLIGVDADQDAVSRARDVLANAAPTVVLVHDNSRNIARIVRDHGYSHITKMMLDLGWSSYQLSAGRGFSFLSDDPLSMAYNAGQTLTAETIVNSWEESSIRDVIAGWGEERYASRIAKRIVEEREAKPIKTAKELAEIVKAAVPAAYRHRRIHPATKTFQALRIAVNDELGALTHVLEDAWQLLTVGGRMVIISFHSLEDRIVKRRFAEWVREGKARLPSRKPIPPSEEEVRANPRARSAKLRVIEKI